VEALEVAASSPQEVLAESRHVARWRGNRRSAQAILRRRNRRRGKRDAVKAFAKGERQKKVEALEVAASPQQSKVLAESEGEAGVRLEECERQKIVVALEVAASSHESKVFVESEGEAGVRLEENERQKKVVALEVAASSSQEVLAENRYIARWRGNRRSAQAILRRRNRRRGKRDADKALARFYVKEIAPMLANCS
jgi:ribosomal protein L21E